MEFLHQPKNLDKFAYSPVGDKRIWNNIASFMKGYNNKSDANSQITYVGFVDGFHYFQIYGLNKFARKSASDFI